MSRKSAQAEKMAAQFQKRYGAKSAGLGSERHKLNVIPTGIPSLDEALGIGGWPLGYCVEVYGHPDVGKSSVIAFNAIREAQQMGKLCALIAVEPGFDPDWAARQGVNPDELLIARPSTGEEAFSMLYDCVAGGADFVVFDSIGALLRESETQPDGKMAQGGQAGLISWGAKRVLNPIWMSNVCVMFLNQQRDDMNSRISGLVEAPGGWALKHSCSIRVWIRNTGKPIKEKINGVEVVVARDITATVKRNKHTQGSAQSTTFTFQQQDTDTHKVGVHVGPDLVATAKRLGIMQGSGWLSHPLFPGGKLQGVAAVSRFLDEHPAALKEIRAQIVDLTLAGQVVEEVPAFVPEEATNGAQG